MNSPGHWINNYNKLQFVDSDLSQIYGVVRLSTIEETLPWYWEAWTCLETRVDDTLPRGYAETKQEAKQIVEEILYLTKTVERP